MPKTESPKIKILVSLAVGDKKEQKILEVEGKKLSEEKSNHQKEVVA